MSVRARLPGLLVVLLACLTVAYAAAANKAGERIDAALSSTDLPALGREVQRFDSGNLLCLDACPRRQITVVALADPPLVRSRVLTDLSTAGWRPITPCRPLARSCTFRRDGAQMSVRIGRFDPNAVDPGELDAAFHPRTTVWAVINAPA